jgi:hypothetical protein
MLQEEEQKSSGILFQPTQAYVGKETEDEKVCTVINCFSYYDYNLI